jgi:hypothetical protein
MRYTSQQIVADLVEHIEKSGVQFSIWYVGISQDPRARLFTDHRVPEKGAWWIYRQASSAGAARDIEDHFINKLGTDGGTGGGDKNSDFVYAYKKFRDTDP